MSKRRPVTKPTGIQAVSVCVLLDAAIADGGALCVALLANHLPSYSCYSDASSHFNIHAAHGSMRNTNSFPCFNGPECGKPHNFTPVRAIVNCCSSLFVPYKTCIHQAKQKPSAGRPCLRRELATRTKRITLTLSRAEEIPCILHGAFPQQPMLQKPKDAPRAVGNL